MQAILGEFQVIVRSCRSNYDAIEAIVISKFCEDAKLQALAIHGSRTFNVRYRAGDS
jgi:hypothetical protein